MYRGLRGKVIVWTLWLCLWVYLTASIAVLSFDRGYVAGAEQTTKIFLHYAK